MDVVDVWKRQIIRHVQPYVHLKQDVPVCLRNKDKQVM